MVDIDILRSPTGAPATSDADLASTVDENSFVLTVTEKGYGKRTTIDEFKTQKRGGKGITAIKFKEKAGGGGRVLRLEGKDTGDADALSCMRVCHPGDEIVLTTSRGTVCRQRVDELSIQSRTATGVMIQKIGKDDKIATIDIVPPAKEE
jgi:DNA gyrase subunit A